MRGLYNLYTKYKEIINYLIFGVLTTLVNFCVYFFLVDISHFYYVYANIIAWFISVLFAYITNRAFVFDKVSFTLKAIIIEMSMFFAARFLSGFIETALLFLMVDKLSISNAISKISVAVIVVVLNYIFSKLIIFKRRRV